MGSFSKDSLELLRSRIDLIEVLSPHLKLQKSGASYKALCPFHDEKSPSFVIQRGESHYHCFGCGAHGDAIQFLMAYLKMSFVEAVESLADRFSVELQEIEKEESKGPSKAALKEALERASQFYHFFLLHTVEGHAALDYLYSRGICLEFIKAFELGLSPKTPKVFLKVMWEHKISNQTLEDAGLLSKGREFFSDRIMIPIRDGQGSIIGFSSRKFKNHTFGGKYINSPETALFKKSKVLFGLSFSRKKIAKTGKVLIVEGQIDALRLIHMGFDWTVAGQGTAFGSDHGKELVHLGVKPAYLAFDGDLAGKEASVKVGQLIQKEGIDVSVLSLEEKTDPDQFLQEKGPHEWQKKIDQAENYLPFLVRYLSSSIRTDTPAGKNELVQGVAKQIREWEHPLMVHEALRKLAQLTQTPEAMVQVTDMPNTQGYIKRSASVSFSDVDPDQILEADVLRWLFLMGESLPPLISIAEHNLQSSSFKVPAARTLYEKYTLGVQEKSSRDLLSLAIDLEKPEHQLFLAEILQKRVNREKALSGFIEAVQKLLDRNWMREREEIKLKIFSGTCSEEEVLDLARQFDAIKKKRPQIEIPS